jgi:hypothetical protein
MPVRMACEDPHSQQPRRLRIFGELHRPTEGVGGEDV